ERAGAGAKGARGRGCQGARGVRSGGESVGERVQQDGELLDVLDRPVAHRVPEQRILGPANLIETLPSELAQRERERASVRRIRRAIDQASLAELAHRTTHLPLVG